MGGVWLRVSARAAGKTGRPPYRVGPINSSGLPDRPSQYAGLAVEWMACAGTALGIGCRELSRLADAVRGRRHFLDSPGLLAAGNTRPLGLLFHHVVQLRTPLQRARDRRDPLRAGVRAADRFLDHAGGFAGRVGGSARQVPNLVRHYREAHSRFSRPGRFHGGVQSQNVCLKRDLVDDLDYFRDLPARAVDLPDRLGQSIHRGLHLGLDLRFLLHRRGRLIGNPGALFDHAGNFFRRRGDLFQG